MRTYWWACICVGVLTCLAVLGRSQGSQTESRRATIRAIEALWREQGIEFEDLGDGGFRVSVRSAVLDRLHPSRRMDFRVGAKASRPARYRA